MRDRMNFALGVYILFFCASLRGAAKTCCKDSNSDCEGSCANSVSTAGPARATAHDDAVLMFQSASMVSSLFGMRGAGQNEEEVGRADSAGEAASAEPVGSLRRIWRQMEMAANLTAENSSNVEGLDNKTEPCSCDCDCRLDPCQCSCYCFGFASNETLVNGSNTTDGANYSMSTFEDVPVKRPVNDTAPCECTCTCSADACSCDCDCIEGDEGTTMDVVHEDTVLSVNPNTSASSATLNMSDPPTELVYLVMPQYESRVQGAKAQATSERQNG